MEFYNRPSSSIQPSSLKEIDELLKRRYLDRLNQRVRKLRKLLICRDWEEIRAECSHLVVSGQTFKFPSLTHLALEAKDSIPNGKLSKAATPTNAKERIEALIKILDQILIEYRP